MKRHEPDHSVVRPLLSTVTGQVTPALPLARRLRCPAPSSKAILLILLWNTMVGFTFATVIFSSLALLIGSSDTKFYHLVHYFAGMYGFIALIQMLFYPFGGLIADLRCGRYRTVFCSMGSLWAGYLVLAVVAVVAIIHHYHHHHHHHHLAFNASYTVLGVVIGLLLITGFTGFQANAVQFGLDQLLDVSSTELSRFLHWFVWMDSVGAFITRMVGAFTLCSQEKSILLYSPFVILSVVTGFAVLTYYKRKWFNCEPRTHSPYGMVYRVLKFTAQHSQPPARRSAFAYCDDEIPSRLDFAKQRYGGPFSTETVEDVKTFLRILVMLVAIGPVFSLLVPTVYVFPLFGMHMGMNMSVSPTRGCDVQWLLFQSNNLSDAIAILLLPLYIILVHPHIPKWCPRILTRLGVGVALLVVSVASMLVIESVGHFRASEHTTGNVSCLFISEYRANSHFSHTLQLPEYVLVFPNVLTGVGVPVLLTTVLEFISAQSPHTMKGLLLGVFYATRGLFIILGCVFIFPFAQEHLWKPCTGKNLNCGFYYYLINTLFGVLSFTVFGVAVKWYQYREREDVPYDPHYVENYYTRYASTTTTTTTSTSPDQHEGKSLLTHSLGKYGTV